MKTGCWGICSFLLRIRVKGLISWVQHLKTCKCVWREPAGATFWKAKWGENIQGKPKHRKIRIKANILIGVHWVYLEHEEKTQSRWFGLQSFALSKWVFGGMPIFFHPGNPESINSTKGKRTVRQSNKRSHAWNRSRPADGTFIPKGYPLVMSK